MATIPEFNLAQLQSICDVLGDTRTSLDGPDIGTGLTGSDIGRFLSRLGINDPQPGITKRRRLFAALSQRQAQDHCGNLVVAFIHTVMNPVLYTNSAESFRVRQEELNKVLAFCGYKLEDDGKLRKQEAVRTLIEAEERAGKLKSELQRRKVHPDILTFCRAELIQNNYFHAVFEATKSVADKIRSKSGLSKDGAPLVDEAFGLGRGGMPYLAFNSLRTETERMEHTGIMNLMKGMFGTFRNVTAHAPKVDWPISEQDALDLLTIASFLHRRLDVAVRTPRP